MPTTALDSERLAGGVLLADILNEVGLAKSKGEGRRLIAQGGVSLNDAKIADATFSINADHAIDGAILLRVGKKRFHRLLVG